MSESLTPLAPRPYTAQKAREPYAEWKEKKLHAIETTDHALRALDLTTGMRSLPFELRDMIFRFVMYNRLRLDCSKGKTPILVAALRGTEFYDEVLKLWYRETFVRLGEGRGPNPYSLRDLKPAMFLRLKKLRVDYKYKDYEDSSPGSIYLFPDLNHGKEKYKRILLAGNLQEVCLNVSKLYNSDVEQHVEKLVAMWLTNFKTLKKFTIDGIYHNFEAFMVIDNSKVQNLEDFWVESGNLWSSWYGGGSDDLTMTSGCMANWEAEKGEFLSWEGNP